MLRIGSTAESSSRFIIY